MALGSIRHHRRLGVRADEIWELVGDPSRLHEWFPGMTASTVEGDQRRITVGSGAVFPETILVNDPVQHRFQYRLDLPIITHHRGTIDAIDLEDGSCLVVYTTDCDPRTMALVIAGGTAGALDELERRYPWSPPGTKPNQGD